MMGALRKYFHNGTLRVVLAKCTNNPPFFQQTAAAQSFFSWENSHMSVCVFMHIHDRFGVHVQAVQQGSQWAEDHV